MIRTSQLGLYKSQTLRP